MRYDLTRLAFRGASPDIPNRFHFGRVGQDIAVAHVANNPVSLISPVMPPTPTARAELETIRHIGIAPADGVWHTAPVFGYKP